MTPKPQVAILFLPFLFLSSAMAFNITEILEPFPEFSNFSNYLNQTDLVHEINHRQTITVLVVDNSRMSAISSLPEDSLMHVMEAHIILDYYDIRKINTIQRRSFLLTTLFQTSGVATAKMGFLNVTHKEGGSVVFGSAVRGAPHTSTLVKEVTTMPYNISVLQISDPIVPPGIDGAPPIAPTTAPPDTTDPSAEAPVEAEAPAESPEEDVADAPADAPGPESSDPPADSPEADQPTSDATEEPSITIPPNKVSDASASISLRSRFPVGAILGLFMGVVVFLINYESFELSVIYL